MLTPRSHQDLLSPKTFREWEGRRSCHLNDVATCRVPMEGAKVYSGADDHGDHLTFPTLEQLEVRLMEHNPPPQWKPCGSSQGRGHGLWEETEGKWNRGQVWPCHLLAVRPG